MIESDLGLAFLTHRVYRVYKLNNIYIGKKETPSGRGVRDTHPELRCRIPQVLLKKAYPGYPTLPVF
jgi:hypothetical protein